MEITRNELPLVLSIIEDQGTLDLVRDFLKERGLHHSAGSWADMRSQRLEPYFFEGSIASDDLVSLMRAAEEYGHQHVFLYRCSQGEAARLMGRDRVAAALDDAGLAAILEDARLVDQPQAPTVVDVRWEPEGDDGQMLVVKYVSTRERRSLKAEEDHGNEIVQVWSVERYRAVTVFRLHSDGGSPFFSLESG